MITNRQGLKTTTKNLHTDISHVVSVIMTCVRDAYGGKYRTRAIIKSKEFYSSLYLLKIEFVNVVKDRVTSWNFGSLVRIQPSTPVGVAQSGRAKVRKALCSFIPVHWNVLTPVLNLDRPIATDRILQETSFCSILSKLKSLITEGNKVYAQGGVWSGILQRMKSLPDRLFPIGHQVWQTWCKPRVTSLEMNESGSTPHQPRLDLV